MRNVTKYRKPNYITYKITQIISNIFARLVFIRKFVRNEIKGKKGAFVVIANHETQLDFVNLIGATNRRMTFVISNSFYNSLPINKVLKSLQVIPKQQFQTEYQDIKRIKAVVDSGNPFVIYPAGLMTENGLSTPLPTATYKFLKMLGEDVYVARSYGTYFSMPKWSNKIRRGRTYIDIYKLYDKEELKGQSIEKVKAKVEDALFFDAYFEQEKLMEVYDNNNDIEGLENVLYKCPKCGKEFSMRIKNKDTVYCDNCDFEEKCDKFGFLHNNDKDNEIRYVPEWDCMIYDKLKKEIENFPDFKLSSETMIQMIDYKKHKFVDVGKGVITLNKVGFILSGEINGEKANIKIPMKLVPTLPFKPGKYIELQYGESIYRCVLKYGALSMKFIHAIKAFYEINNKVRIKTYPIPNKIPLFLKEAKEL